MRKEDLRLRVWYGEGYYSGASSLHVLAYDINDKELLEKSYEEFTQEERSMGELDGKHSEVLGEMEEDIEDFVEIIFTYKEADEDVFEEGYFEPDDYEVKEALQKAYDFINSFKLKEVYKHKETGEVLDMSQYESKLVVVEK